MHIVALGQMLPSGEVYFRQVMTSKLPREPRMELILFSDLQFGPTPSGQIESAFLESLLRVSRSLLDSFR